MPAQSVYPTPPSDTPSSRPVSTSTVDSALTVLAPRFTESPDSFPTPPRDHHSFSSISSSSSSITSPLKADITSVFERATSDTVGSRLPSPATFNMYKLPTSRKSQGRRSPSILDALGPIKSPPIPSEKITEMPSLLSTLPELEEEEIL